MNHLAHATADDPRLHMRTWRVGGLRRFAVMSGETLVLLTSSAADARACIARGFWAMSDADLARIGARDMSSRRSLLRGVRAPSKEDNPEEAQGTGEEGQTASLEDIKNFLRFMFLLYPKTDPNIAKETIRLSFGVNALMVVPSSPINFPASKVAAHSSLHIQEELLCQSRLSKIPAMLVRS